MTSNEMVTIAFAAEMIRPKLEAKQKLWRAYMDLAPTSGAKELEAARVAHRQSLSDLAVAVELYLPTILSAIERAKEAA